MTWKSVDGTATAASGDYAGGTGTLTFLPGQTVKTITVFVNGDTTPEPNETFIVQISGATGATVGTNLTTITILDDDSPSVSVAGTDLNGAEQAQDPIVFTITRSNNLAGPITINLTWGGTATYGTDYTVLTSTGTLAPNGSTLTLAGGVSSVTLTVRPADDSVVESPETVILTLGSGNGAYNVGSPSTQTGTIADNDKVTVNVSSLSISEGNTGTKQATVIVLLSAAAPYPITVTVATTAPGSTAPAGSDYVAASQTLTFAAGVTSQAFSVTINGDRTVEPDEIIRLTATSSTAQIGTVGTITILNDDSGPAPLAAGVAPLSTVAPGSAAPSAATATVTDAPPPAPIAAAAPAADAPLTAATPGSATPSAATMTSSVAPAPAPIAAAAPGPVTPSAATATFSAAPLHPSPARNQMTKRGG